MSLGGVPYVALDEYDASNIEKIRVRRLEPEYSWRGRRHCVRRDVVAQVDDFGLALPVAFEYGATPRGHHDGASDHVGCGDLDRHATSPD